MNHKYLLAIALLFTCISAHAQNAFRKGSLLLSISEGITPSTYTTTNVTKNNETPYSHYSKMDGVRDPLFIEFGLTNRWGIGLSTGNDLFDIDPNKYYGFHLSDNREVNVKTSEFTFDVNYHFYTRQRIDWSLYTSVGSFGVAFDAKDGANNYTYNAKGGIIRMGTKLRYYFWGRLGALGMLSTYSGTASPENIGSNNIASAKNTETSISGYALEFGLCFRFF